MTQLINAGRIGPNAILRIQEVLIIKQNQTTVQEIFQHAGLLNYLAVPPTEMVLEQEVIDLHKSLRLHLGISIARSISHDAGQRTAEYLLARRIPQFVQIILKVLPAFVASRILLQAIQRNAWTFVGTGQFVFEPAYPPKIIITKSPLCRDEKASEPLCDYYVGCFERLFKYLVQRKTEVREIVCHSMGAAECQFELRWRESFKV